MAKLTVGSGHGPRRAVDVRPHALLLTGAPGVGKTTVLRKIASNFAGRAAGLTTAEIREYGRRVGFRIAPFEGRSRVMAHVDFRGTPRVSAYGVDVAAIDAMVDDAFARARHVAVYLVDEIGKMECLSARFVSEMRRLLDSDTPVVATIARCGSGFIAEVKRRRDIELWEVTRENRDVLVERVLRWFSTVENRG